MGFSIGFGSSKSKGKSKSTTAPWGPQIPYLEDLFEGGESLWRSGETNLPDFNFTAGPTQNELDGRQGYLDAMPNLADMNDQAKGAWTSQLNAPDIANNGYVQQFAAQRWGRVDRVLRKP
jgi:hypothetical protein